MFDIPMKTSGAMDLNSMLSGNSATGMPQLNAMQYAQPSSQAVTPQYTQQNVQAYPQQTPNVQQYQQPAPQATQFYQQSTPQSGMQYQQAPQATQPYQQPVMSTQHPTGGGVHLKKGQKFALTGANGSTLTVVDIGLGWDLVNQECDLDVSAFMLDSSNRVIGDNWFVFYGQTNSPDGSVQHSGDSKGAGVGDDEVITIDLTRVDQRVQKITFVVTIDEALARGQNFSMVANAYVRVVDKNTTAELARFNLTDYYATVTSMVVGELYRHNGTWKFNPVGDGVAKDLAGLCAMYGVNVAD